MAFNAFKKEIMEGLAHEVDRFTKHIDDLEMDTWYLKDKIKTDSSQSKGVEVLEKIEEHTKTLKSISNVWQQAGFSRLHRLIDHLAEEPAHR